MLQLLSCDALNEQSIVYCFNLVYFNLEKKKFYEPLSIPTLIHMIMFVVVIKY